MLSIVSTSAIPAVKSDGKTKIDQMESPFAACAAFKAAELTVISKIDLAPHVDFDISRCEAMAREVNPEIRSIHLSARTGEGLGDWYEWLRKARRHLVLAAAQ
jgi:G3E family GTPase